jgi:hypothetical protein
VVVSGYSSKATETCPAWLQLLPVQGLLTSTATASSGATATVALLPSSHQLSMVLPIRLLRL